MLPLPAARLLLAMSLIVVGSALLVPYSTLRANGGTMRLSRGSAGPFALTVFTAPTPLRVGLADVSVAVERADTGDLEPNARVIVFAAPSDGATPATAYEASHERATDPSFYAADVHIPTAGRWRFEVLVLTSTVEGRTSFEVDVEPFSQAPDRRLISLAAAALLLMLALVARSWLLRSSHRSTDHDA